MHSIARIRAGGLARHWRAYGRIAAAAAPQELRATIGLELHIQLLAAHKLFSAASTSWDDRPNTNVCATDAGLPGALPRLNPECVSLAARAVLALNGQIQQRCAFDRKHYFYADQPLGYQITQQRRPIGRGGFLELGPADGLGCLKRIRIRQLQLEQDTAKSIHGVHPEYVLVDLNRAGVALVEIVSEPDIDTAEEAVAYVRKMQALLRHVGVSKCNMEEGSLRCDVNVSVHRPGEDRLSGTRCELKNLNSLKVIQGAVNAEIARQSTLVARGEAVGQETRGYNARDSETFPMRSKEAAPDYRYMPEPDVPEVHISDEWIARVRSSLPETPEAALARARAQYDLSQETVETLLGEPGCLEFFEEAALGRSAKTVSSWITSEVFGQLAYRGQRLAESPLTARQLTCILDALHGDAITPAQAKLLLIGYMDGESRGVGELVAAHGWEVISNDAQLRGLAEQLLNAHPKEVAGYLKGQTRRLNFFVGKLMQATKDQAKPQVASRIVKDALDARR
ncbi:hypothetical protein LPJ61_002671 [Coemansia biformis]|uniref:Glutamyl-tRNA(Gln) amidotransferase subunit B, mitochondrial n=1 Tax=Coemansia biformis TaxID=1286918 RepID=A0A9W7YEB6_9FUNG|nr:hypothetical protein LPJ61_002671 [Coemansia biformis]